MDGEQNRQGCGAGSETSQVGGPCAWRWADCLLPTEAVHLKVLGAHPGGKLGRKLGDSVGVCDVQTYALLLITGLIPLCLLLVLLVLKTSEVILCFVCAPWGQELRKMCHQQKGLLGRSQVAAALSFELPSKAEKLLQDLANKYLLISCLN